MHSLAVFDTVLATAKSWFHFHKFGCGAWYIGISRNTPCGLSQIIITQNDTIISILCNVKK